MARETEQAPRHGMVRWYNPLILLRSGVRSVATTTIGWVIDYREIQANLDPVGPDNDFGTYDYRAGGAADDIWIDYVADLGDGWDATYAVAQALAADTLTFDGGEVPRGGILIMGGDQVYPDPSDDGYKERTINPYRAACGAVTPFKADLFALPGNHDWYDGLHDFNEVFCSSRRRYRRGDGYHFDCWETRQSRSYFALRLPHDWWLCGIDIQLNRRLNAAQLEYFQTISEELMQPGDRIVLCAAMPSWVIEVVREKGTTQNLVEIADLLGGSGAEVKMVLSGDLHHYSHYSPQAEGPELVTAGGGGAFLHPTHKLPAETAIAWKNGTTDRFDLGAVAPEKATSWRLSYRNLLFPFINWECALLIGGIYSILSWFLETRQPIGDQSLSEAFQNMMSGQTSIADTLTRFFETIPKSPEFAILVGIVFAALVGFNVNGTKTARLALGVVHTLAHFVALILAFCIAAQLNGVIVAQHGSPTGGFTLFLGMMVLFGGLLGGLVFGLFLLASLNVFGLQWTNAFSSLRIADHKCFLRLRIGPDGALTVYPFKIEKTGSDPSPPELIETPFTLK